MSEIAKFTRFMIPLMKRCMSNSQSTTWDQPRLTNYLERYLEDVRNSKNDQSIKLDWKTDGF